MGKDLLQMMYNYLIQQMNEAIPVCKISLHFVLFAMISKGWLLEALPIDP